MDMKDYDINFKEKRTNGYLIATLFIIVGILFLLRNLGMIDPSLFDLLVSWPMLLVVSGIFTIFHRNPVGGMLLVGVGVYFLFPQLNWITNDFLRVYWPLGLILLGLVIMLKRKDSIRTKKHKTTTRSLLIISCFLFRLAKSRPMGGCSLDAAAVGVSIFNFASVVL